MVLPDQMHVGRGDLREDLVRAGQIQLLDLRENQEPDLLSFGVSFGVPIACAPRHDAGDDRLRFSNR